MECAISKYIIFSEDGKVFSLFCLLGKSVVFASQQGVSFWGGKVLFYAILLGVLVRWEWKPLNSLSQGKGNVGSFALPRLCVTPSPLCWVGLGFVRSPEHMKRGSACSLQDPPSCCTHRNIIRKDGTSTNSVWILKGELSDIKRPGRWETASPLNDGMLRWRSEWISLCTLYIELPSLRSHRTLREILSLDLGD